MNSKLRMKNYLSKSRSSEIHHYTTIEKLALILKSGNIRCTRLDMVDDIEETKLYGDNNFANFIFVSCWTKAKEEHIPFWNMYSNHYQGVRITLPNNFLLYKKHEYPFRKINKDRSEETSTITGFSAIPKQKLRTENYQIVNSGIIDLFPTFKEVKYKSRPQGYFKKNISQTDKPSINITGNNFGTIKSEFWAFQEEVRIVLIIFPSDRTTEKAFEKTQKLFNGNNASQKHIKYFDLPIDPELLDKIKITMGPKSREGEKLVVESLLKQYTKNGTLNDSQLKGLIR